MNFLLLILKNILHALAAIPALDLRIKVPGKPLWYSITKNVKWEQATLTLFIIHVGLGVGAPGFAAARPLDRSKINQIFSTQNQDIMKGAEKDIDCQVFGLSTAYGWVWRERAGGCDEVYRLGRGLWT